MFSKFLFQKSSENEIEHNDKKCRSFRYIVFEYIVFTANGLHRDQPGLSRLERSKVYLEQAKV